MWGESQNTSQDGLQLIILLIAVICVPLMLLPKPIIEIRKLNKLKAKENPLLLAEDELEDDMEAERGVVLAKAAHEGSSDHSVAHGQDAG